ncbi:MAG: MoaD/ThiS family protein [Rhodospirillales bacterium]|nr:MoaD/ThiS family protein [Rhodospirillales bacterium]
MKIRLNFVALELDHLPAEGKDEMELQEGSNLLEALELLGLGEDKSYLTLVNESSIPTSQRTATVLADGDTLTLFSPIKGG